MKSYNINTTKKEWSYLTLEPTIECKIYSKRYLNSYPLIMLKRIKSTEQLKKLSLNLQYIKLTCHLPNIYLK
jgi:protein gp37